MRMSGLDFGRPAYHFLSHKPIKKAPVLGGQLPSGDGREVCTRTLEPAAQRQFLHFCDDGRLAR